MPGQLVAQAGLKHGDVEFLLAEQGKLPAILKPKEVRQLGRPDSFGAGSLQQHPVHLTEARRIIAQHGAGHRVPPRAVGPGTV
jgi:hypothetical protein